MTEELRKRAMEEIQWIEKYHGAQPDDLDFWNAISSIKYALATALPQWQPIETAPKDGTRVLVWSDELYLKPYIAWWGVDANHPEHEPDQFEWLTGDGDDWSTGYYYTPCAPTHWQPLPEPPTT